MYKKKESKRYYLALAAATSLVDNCQGSGRGDGRGKKGEMEKGEEEGHWAVLCSLPRVHMDSTGLHMCYDSFTYFSPLIFLIYSLHAPTSCLLYLVYILISFYRLSFLSCTAILFMCGLMHSMITHAHVGMRNWLCKLQGARTIGYYVICC